MISHLLSNLRFGKKVENPEGRRPSADLLAFSRVFQAKNRILEMSYLDMDICCESTLANPLCNGNECKRVEMSSCDSEHSGLNWIGK
jgi:hypothetical protein